MLQLVGHPPGVPVIPPGLSRERRLVRAGTQPWIWELNGNMDARGFQCLNDPGCVLQPVPIVPGVQVLALATMATWRALSNYVTSVASASVHLILPLNHRLD